MENKTNLNYVKICLLVYVFLGVVYTNAQDITIPIETKDHALVFQTDKENRLKTIYFGEALLAPAYYSEINKEYNFTEHNNAIYNSTYTPAGTWSLTEPAVQVTHADGNPSLELNYKSYNVEQIDGNITLTSIVLNDPVYPFQITLFYKAYYNENVIEQWTEIMHQEKEPVTLKKYASANLYFDDSDYYLTTYANQHVKEMQPQTTLLKRGMTSVDSKLGARALMFHSPTFLLSTDQRADENSGTVILGHLAWSGNFKLEFEVDSYKNLRLIAGINPFASEYQLAPNKKFTTPKFMYAISSNGVGEASRNLHNWARKNKILDGKGNRLTLLNNWEATHFDFDEEKLTELLDDTKKLGVDLFLLDDGWFGNKHPRNDDSAGLGDWQVNKKKLPNGIGYLIKEAKKRDVKFGIWIEPEMVNPNSDLYEKHPEWVIRMDNRPEKHFRNQLVLDLSNPDVQDFIFKVVDDLFTEDPEIAFIKWDCNSVIYNAYSKHLENQGLPQSHLYVDFVQGLYKVLERVREKYPLVPMMLCSGGGGRADYELLKYFTEFWPSDNTNPHERIFMQWEYSKFFPAIVSDSHVTKAGNYGIKYRMDVACMGKLGFDIVAEELSEKELLFSQKAIREYDTYKRTIWDGDIYRLQDPYNNPITSLVYVDENKSKAIMFNYLIDFQLIKDLQAEPIKLQGLDPNKKYTIRELNLHDGIESKLDEGKTYSGDFLMKVGVNPKIESDPWKQNRLSVVIEFSEVK